MTYLEVGCHTDAGHAARGGQTVVQSALGQFSVFVFQLSMLDESLCSLTLLPGSATAGATNLGVRNPGATIVAGTSLGGMTAGETSLDVTSLGGMTGTGTFGRRMTGTGTCGSRSPRAASTGAGSRWAVGTDGYCSSRHDTHCEPWCPGSGTHGQC
jgi:hypothetical protein